MCARYNAPHDSRRHVDWLERAHADLHACKLLLANNGDRLLAVFHAHQTIEKSLKAFMLFAARQHIDGHNLMYLCRQALRLDGSFAMYLPDCAKMGRYYIETRYPTDLPVTIDEETANGVLKVAEKLYRHVCTVAG
jgi:HEPN domain-containing protein